MEADSVPKIINLEATQGNHLPWVTLLIILLLTAALRIHLLSVPLERDEGEYAYAGQLLLQGVPPYAQMYNMKMPGIYVCYALLMAVFGQSHLGIHLGLLFVDAGSIILVFLLGRRLWGDWAGVAAAMVFSVMMLTASVQDISANAEHFVLPPMLAGLLVLLNACRGNSERSKAESAKRRLMFVAGLLLGLGFIIKQHGAAYIAWGGLYLLGCALRQGKKGARNATDPSFAPEAASVSSSTAPRLRSLVQHCLFFAVGAALPFALTCAAFCLLNAAYGRGIFHEFWFWTFTYAGQYVSQVSFSQAWGNLQAGSPFYLANPAATLWALSILGLFTPAWNRRVRASAPFLLGFLVFSLIAVCPGLYFRPHYFVLAMPALALWAGAAAQGVATLLAGPGESSRWVHPLAAISVAAAAAAYALAVSPGHLLITTRADEVNRAYTAKPFPEALAVAAYIRDHTSPKDRIAVIGSEPEIYFYAHRRSATGYVYMYPLMDAQPFALTMQQQLMREVEGNQPTILVFVGVSNSWLKKPNSYPLILNWFDDYSRRYFERMGVVVIKPQEPADYFWGDAAKKDPPLGDPWISIYRRIVPLSPLQGRERVAGTPAG